MTSWSAQIGHHMWHFLQVGFCFRSSHGSVSSKCFCYGADVHKCGTFFTSRFISRVKDITKTFHDIMVNQIHVCYLEDENCYVNLEEALMAKLFRCVRHVPGTDCKRIDVHAKVEYSPMLLKKRKNWDLKSSLKSKIAKKILATTNRASVANFLSDNSPEKSDTCYFHSGKWVLENWNVHHFH